MPARLRARGSRDRWESTMTMQELIHDAIFAFLALVTVGSAIQVAATRRIIHAAFWLFPVFAGIAGFYLYLGAQFIAAIQVLIYIGAILVLIVFAVTLTRHANDDEERQSNRYAVPMILAAIVMLVPLGGAAWLGHWPVPVADLDAFALANPLAAGVQVGDVAAIGIVLLQKYLVPFEVASVLLLAAMVGALVLARRESKPVTAVEAEATPVKVVEARELAEV